MIGAIAVDVAGPTPYLIVALNAKYFALLLVSMCCVEQLACTHATILLCSVCCSVAIATRMID